MSDQQCKVPAIALQYLSKREVSAFGRCEGFLLEASVSHTEEERKH